VIRIYTTAHVQFLQSLSSFGPNLDEIFEVAERWVVVDYPGADTYDSALRKLCLCAKGGPFWDTSGSVEAHSYRGPENAGKLQGLFTRIYRVLPYPC